MKGTIKPDHIGVNNYSLKVLGLLELTAVKISGLEDELESVALPDRTNASGGNRKSTSFEMEIPAHHKEEIAIMEIWFRESQDPVLPTYKKPAVLKHLSLSKASSLDYTLVGLFPMKRMLPDLDMANEGDMAVVKWSMSVDDILPI